MQSRKIVFVITACAILVTASVALSSLIFIKSSFLSITDETLKTVLDTDHHSIRTWASENGHHIKVLAKSPLLISLVESLLEVPTEPQFLIESEANVQLKSLIKTTLSEHAMRGYFIIGAGNISLSSTRDSNIGTLNLLDKQDDYLSRLWGGETLISPPLASDVPLKDREGRSIVGYPTMFVGTAIRDNKNNIIALLTLRLDPRAELKEILNHSRIGNTGETYLIDKDGNLLTSSRFDEELWQRKTLKQGESSTFNIQLKKVLKNGEASPILGPSGITNGSNVKGYLDYRGRYVIGAWSWDEQYGFGVVSEMDLAEAYKAYRHTQWIFGAFTLASIIILCITALVFNKLQTRIQRQQNQYKSLFENAADAMLIVASDSGNIISANALACTLFKYTKDELEGMDVSNLSPDAKLKTLHCDLEGISKSAGKPYETQCQAKTGEIIPVETSARLVPFESTNAILSIIRDISERKAADRLLLKLASTDTLTGLSNRTLFEQQLNISALNCVDTHKQLALIFIGLDEFRIINDTLGHEIGDRILKIAAKRMSHATPKGLEVFRFGGDEFTVIAEIEDKQEVIDLSDAIHASFKRPLQIDENELNITVSTGIAIADAEDLDISGLIQDADSALNTAKHQGRNRSKFFSSDMREKDELHLSISRALNYALKDKELSLVFQPVVRTRDNKLVGAEALLRWHSQKLGPVRPDIFIPIAEDCGKINELGAWVLDEACRVRAQWLALGMNELRMSINLSPIQMLSTNISSLVQATLLKHNIDASMIAMEVTEGASLENRSEFSEQLSSLKALGVQLYLDDFGTGYSSLSYLSKYPFHLLKLDKSFVTDIETNIMHQSLAKTVIAMADSLNMEVIAEGVETPWQNEFLCDIGCHRIQGYLYGKPIPPDEFLQQWHSSTAEHVSLLGQSPGHHI